ncbi:hypothetical protein ACC807_10930 [Rhizobium ruizarguesonis]
MDDNLTQYLKCDVELNFTGPSHAVVNKWAADVLRALADRIEKDEFEDGHHEVKDRVGKPVGSIYLDFSEGDEFL